MDNSFQSRLVNDLVDDKGVGTGPAGPLFNSLAYMVAIACLKKAGNKFYC